jgi:hypothetical protein
MLDMSTVAPPEDEKDVLHCRKAAGAPVSTVLLGLVLLRGDMTVVFLEHVALLEGVVDQGLVEWAWLLQHVVKHVGDPRSLSRALTGRVNREGLVLVIIAPLRARVAAGLLAFLAPLVFLLGFLGLSTLRGHVFHVFALLAVEDGPHCLLAGSKAGGDVEQIIGVNQRASPELAHKVPTGRALEESMHNLGLSHTRELSAVLGKALYEVLKRLAGLLGARP